MGDKQRKADKRPKTEALDWPGCQLMLTVTAGGAAADVLRAALEACQASAVLIQPVTDRPLGAEDVKPLVALAQDAGAAAILYEDVRLARALRADGVHFGAASAGDVADIIADARASLGQAANIGIDAGISRHRAMEAGEAGADYVAFGAAEGTLIAQQARNDLIAWWAEIFEVPCVALDVQTVEDAALCDGQGADFVALTLPPHKKPAEAAALAAQLDAQLSVSGAG